MVFGTGEKRERKPREVKPIFIPKTLVEAQRFQLQKLMEHPEKVPDPIEAGGGAAPPEPPEFVRHVTGSSAGAGSGEFHVYRNQRKFEYLRTKWMEEQIREEKAQMEFDETKTALQEVEAAKTAKRRHKRHNKQRNLKLRKIGERTEIEAGATANQDPASGSAHPAPHPPDQGNGAEKQGDAEPDDAIRE